VKCPLCGAPTDVKTTKSDGGTVTRRRHCFNDHTFYTKEAPITEPKPKRKSKSHDHKDTRLVLLVDKDV
jgi:transcriptional regulator NrdR family protein